jgi:acetylornithine deacetylase
MNSALSLLRELVEIPSVSSLSNRPLVEYASRFLHECGWHTRQLPYFDSSGNEKINLIAFPPGQGLEDRAMDLAFVCHTDTVPYDTAWNEAIHPVVRDGFLHGCGACDVKGFLASLLAAPSDLKPGDFHGSICIVLTADEEVGCVGASRLLAANVITARHVVVGEPTSLHPARAGKGYCLAEIKVHGKEAHSAFPSEGASAIYRAAHLIGKVEEIGRRRRAERHDLFDPPFTTVNVGVVEGGVAKNIIPGECRFLVEWRPIPGQDTLLAIRAVEQEMETMRQEDADFRFEITILRNQPGFDAGTGSDLAKSLERITGRSSVSVPFGTEASVFSQIAGDVIVFGPGDMRTAHSNRECVSLAELEECVQYLRALMTSAAAI